MNNLIVLNKNDNVGVSQFIIPEKTKIEGHEISTIDPIPFGHKVCLKTIKKGASPKGRNLYHEKCNIVSM